MEWLSEHAWQAWLALAALLGAAELLSLELTLLMLAVGAGAGAAADLLGLPIVAQVLLAVATSVGLLALVRPSLLRRLHGGPGLTMGADRLVGSEGVTVTAVTADVGQVRIAGELWTARCFDETTTIPAGARVDVMRISGATALVHEIPQIERDETKGIA